MNCKASLTLRCIVYNGYMPCCLDKVIPIYSLSISACIKYWLMSLSIILWTTSKIYTKNYHSISLKKKKLLRDIIISSFNAKDTKIGSDYRKSILYVSSLLIEFSFNHFLSTPFVTLPEIKEISYSSDDEISPQRLLRMTNLIFQNVLIIHIYIRHILVFLTPRKPFGV